MPGLAVDGTEVRTASFALRQEDLTHPTRMFSGRMRTTRATTVATAQVWEVETPLISLSDVKTIKSILLAPGTVDVTGDLVTGTITCHARNVTQSDGPTNTLSSLSFELHEQVPA